MATTYSASVADLLALDALLDGMDDLTRDSIDRAIQYRIDEAKGEMTDEFGTVDEAESEYRDVVRDHAEIRAKLAELTEGEIPAEIAAKLEAIIALVDELPTTLEALDNAVDKAA